MLEQVRNLAALIQVAPPGKKFVLMLGAGASMGAGVKPTPIIMQELVTRFGSADAQIPLEERFDALWEGASESMRESMLAPYLAVKPSPGYRFLAKLIQRGFIEVLITFNFDYLLEEALDDAGIKYLKIVRGETALDAIPTLLARPTPSVKLLKLHGSLRSANHFLFSKEEMLNYPPQLHEILVELTGRNIIVCGYAFNDTCVIRAFNDNPTSEAIFCVNPSGAPSSLKGFMAARRSMPRVIKDELGKFDTFMEALHGALTPIETPSQPAGRRQNFFKFLDHYHEEHKQWFFGRRPQVFEIRKLLEEARYTRIYLSGDPKVGKTSLVCAGVLPHLCKRGFETLYVRCRVDLEQSVRDALGPRALSSGTSLADELAAFKARAAEKGKRRAVIVLDQFEKISRLHLAPDSAASQRALATLQQLVKAADASLCLVFAASDEASFWKFIVDANFPGDYRTIRIKPLSPRMVTSIIRHAARRGGVSLDGRIVQRLVGEYEESVRSVQERRERPPFTLTHVQTFCYYYARSAGRLADQELSHSVLLAALESARNNVSLVDLLDDLPSEERSLFRCLLRIICDPGTSNVRAIVELMRDRFPDIRLDSYPEPIS